MSVMIRTAGLIVVKMLSIDCHNHDHFGVLQSDLTLVCLFEDNTIQDQLHNYVN